MTEIVDLDEARREKHVNGFLEQAKNFVRRWPHIALDNKKVKFYCHGMGGGSWPASKDLLGIMIEDASAEVCTYLGSIHLERGQWEEMKRQGDLMLSFRTYKSELEEMGQILLPFPHKEPPQPPC